MEYRYICSNCTDPYVNLAWERSLLKRVKPNKVILFLWQNEHTIVIGKNQNVYSECKVEEFVADGGKIARRCSGGGAVYHDLGNLNFSLISERIIPEEMKCGQIIIKLVKLFGIHAEFNGRNDLMADKRKFSGSAFYDTGSVLCQHGTILLHTDIEKMEYYLTPSQSKLDRNHVSSVSSRVINLSELSPDITVRTLCDSMVRLTKALPLQDIPNQKEIHENEVFFRDRNWIYGGSI